MTLFDDFYEKASGESNGQVVPVNTGFTNQPVTTNLDKASPIVIKRTVDEGSKNWYKPTPTPSEPKATKITTVVEQNTVYDSSSGQGQQGTITQTIGIVGSSPDIYPRRQEQLTPIPVQKREDYYTESKVEETSLKQEKRNYINQGTFMPYVNENPFIISEYLNRLPRGDVLVIPKSFVFDVGLAYQREGETPKISLTRGTSILTNAVGLGEDNFGVGMIAAGETILKAGYDLFTVNPFSMRSESLIENPLNYINTPEEKAGFFAGTVISVIPKMSTNFAFPDMAITATETNIIISGSAGGYGYAQATTNLVNNKLVSDMVNVLPTIIKTLAVGSTVLTNNLWYGDYPTIKINEELPSLKKEDYHFPVPSDVITIDKTTYKNPSINDNYFRNPAINKEVNNNINKNLNEVGLINDVVNVFNNKTVNENSFKQETLNDLGYVYNSSLSYNNLFAFPTPFKLNFGLPKLKSGVFNNGFKMKRDYGYTSSLSSLVFGIRSGKQPKQKVWTGLEFRPILTSPKSSKYNLSKLGLITNRKQGRTLKKRTSRKLNLSVSNKLRNLI